MAASNISMILETCSMAHNMVCGTIKSMKRRETEVAGVQGRKLCGRTLRLSHD